MSIVDIKRQWFKSKFGLSTPETHRNIAFCSYTVLEVLNVNAVLNKKIYALFAIVYNSRKARIFLLFWMQKRILAL